MYTKKEFGRELMQKITTDFETDRLSAWAYEKYLDHANKLDKETHDAIMTIVFLPEEGFEKTKDELLKFASDLQKDI